MAAVKANKSSPGQVKDGRHARSDRTRTAVASALLGLLEEGEPRPSAKDIAERAGVSSRAIYRHFESLDALQEEVARLQIEKLTRELPPLLMQGSLVERVDALVEHSAHRNELITPVRRTLLVSQPLSDVTRERQQWLREMVRKQIRRVFEPELGGLADGERRDRTAALRGLLSFSYWNALREHDGLSRESASRTLRVAILALLEEH